MKCRISGLIDPYCFIQLIIELIRKHFSILVHAEPAIITDKPKSPVGILHYTEINIIAQSIICSVGLKTKSVITHYSPICQNPQQARSILIDLVRFRTGQTILNPKMIVIVFPGNVI